MKKTIGAAALWLSAAAGCGEPVSPEGFGAEYEEALCAWSSGCSVFQSRGQCRDALAWDTNGRFQYLVEALAAGRVEFDAAAAEVCFEELAALPCDGQQLDEVLYSVGPSAAPAACRDVFVGKVRNYDPCLNSEECAGDTAVCGFPPTCTDACCAGACRVLAGPPQIGEACTGSCEDGAFCALDPSTFAFTVCTARRPVNARCDDVTDSCAEGLYCDSNTDFTCKAQKQDGDACESWWHCAEGLSCYTDGEGGRRCQGLPGEGQSCSNNNYPACARVDNYCDGTRCSKLPGADEECADYGCIPYAECDYNDGAPVCRLRGERGSGCGEASGYRSCMGHLQCGDDDRCSEREAEPTCEVPE